jgi:hypothetical protein
MKLRRILILGAALVAVVSSVAAVSAFESHLVNVQAHVENAVVASGGGSIGGATMFPEEWLTTGVTVDASDSFKNQTRVDTIDYIVCAEPKTIDSPDGDPFEWMGGMAYLSTDGGSTWVWVGPTADLVPPTAGFVCPGISGQLTGAAASVVDVGFDAPVRVENYNEDTDVCDKPRPDTSPHNPQNAAQTGTSDGNAYCQAPSVVVPNTVPAIGEYYGMEVKIQVTGIN